MGRNLYEDNVIIRYNEGDTSLEKISIIPEDSLNDSTHIVKEGDTLQNLAHFFYKDSRRWHVIADKNNLDDIFTLEIGSELIIPDPRKL